MPAVDGSQLINLPVQTDASKLPLIGGTLTGDLTMGANNIITTGTVDGIDVSILGASVTTNTGNITSNDTDIATNATALAEKLPKAGGTMTGAIAMGANKITGLADGTANDHAVTKGQMNTALATKENSIGFIPLATNGTNTMTGDLNFGTNGAIFKETGGGTDTVTLKAPAAGIGTSYILEFPVDDGQAGEVLALMEVEHYIG